MPAETDEDAGPAVNISAPVLITERGRDLHAKTETLTIAWLREGHWHTQNVDRQQIAHAQRIVELAAYG